MFSLCFNTIQSLSSRGSLSDLMDLTGLKELPQELRDRTVAIAWIWERLENILLHFYCFAPSFGLHWAYMKDVWANQDSPRAAVVQSATQMKFVQLVFFCAVLQNNTGTFDYSDRSINLSQTERSSSSPGRALLNFIVAKGRHEQTHVRNP